MALRLRALLPRDCVTRWVTLGGLRECPCYVVLCMQMSILCSALYAKCPYYIVLYMQMSVLWSALYAKCPYWVVLCMQSVLTSTASVSYKPHMPLGLTGCGVARRCPTG